MPKTIAFMTIKLLQKMTVSEEKHPNAGHDDFGRIKISRVSGRSIIIHDVDAITEASVVKPLALKMIRTEPIRVLKCLFIGLSMAGACTSDSLQCGPLKFG